MVPYPGTLNWLQEPPKGNGKSPYFTIGYSWQLPEERGWYEGVFYRPSNVRVGAGVWFTRLMSPNKIYLCLGLLQLDRTGNWQVLAAERKYICSSSHNIKTVL